MIATTKKRCQKLQGLKNAPKNHYIRIEKFEPRKENSTTKVKNKTRTI